MNSRATKTMIAVAVLAMVLSAFAVAVPMDSDAADPLTIDSFEQKVNPSSGKNYLLLTFNQDLAGMGTVSIPEISYESTYNVTVQSNKARLVLDLGTTVLADDVYTIILGGQTTFEGTITVGEAPAPVKVTVTFMDGDDQFGEPVQIDKGTAVPQPTTNPDRAGATFKHWSLTENGEAYDFSTPVNADTTLYAVFEQFVQQQYTVTFVADGDVIGTVTVPSGEMISGEPDAPILAGKEFKYWTLDGTEFDMATPITSDITLVAYYGTVTPVTPTEDPAERTFGNTITLGDGAIIDEDSKIIASYTQEVIIAGDVTVVSGGSIQILGKLTVNEGASLTVETGGKVVIIDYGIVDVKGDLVIEGAQTGYTFTYGGIVMTVSGSVALEGARSFLSTGEGIEVSGLFEIGDDATAQLNGATITKDGKLLVTGVAYGKITNNGEVTIDSQGLGDGSKIDMTIQLGAEGTVDIVNVYGSVTVSDSALGFTEGRDTYSAKYDNSVVLTNVAGVKVTETLTVSEKNGTYTGNNTMFVEGSIMTAVDYNATVENGVVTVAGGNVATTGDVVLGDKVAMQVDGKFTVSAALTATNADSKVVGSGEMTVKGKVTVKVAVPETLKVNAARYTTASPAYTIYTTLETALADGATLIALMGENSVGADATIPVGTTVSMDTGSKLTVSDKAVLTVAADDRNSARFVTAGVDTVDVKGTLVVTNFAKSKVNEDSILSDTSKAVEKTRTYTNIYKALADAADGETVEVTRGADLVLSKDVEVKAGVTLSIPEGEKVIVDNGVTVTVDGTVYTLGDYAIAAAVQDVPETAKDESEAAGVTVVNGLFLFDDDNAGYTKDIVGAYFQYSYAVGNRTVVLNAIAPLASMPRMMDKVESDYVDLFGKMNVGAVDFSAYDGELVVVIAFNQISFESITLGPSVAFAALSYEDYVVTATGTLVLANGSVDVENIMGFVVYNETDAEDVTTSHLFGYATVDSYDNPETLTVTEKGSISFDGAVTMDLRTTTKVSVFVPKDATVTVTAGDLKGAFTVEGAMVVDGTSVVFQDLTVTGTVTAEGNNVAQAVKLFVGVTAKDFAMAGAGSVEGVTLVASDSAVAYVSPNATVGEDITALKATEYYVDDALYLTAYAVAGNIVPINDVEFVVKDAWFNGWMTEKAVAVGAEKVIGDVKKVFADIDYEVFHIEVIADSGIGAVAIDGNVLKNINGNVFYTTAPIKAGQHTVTYTLKSGYTGEAKLSVNGQGATVSGMNFTLSGTPEDAYGIDVELSLFGTTVSDPTIIVEPSQPVVEDDSGMGLIEYLLIVLVILAAVLVVVVSIRMMRS